MRLVAAEWGPIQVIRPGDRVFFEPGEEYWHGAAPSWFMTHLAMLDVNNKAIARRGGPKSPMRSKVQRRRSTGENYRRLAAPGLTYGSVGKSVFQRTGLSHGTNDTASQGPAHLAG